MLNEGFVINAVQDATVRYVLGVQYDIAVGATANAEFRLVVASRTVDRWYDELGVSLLQGTALASLNLAVKKTVKLDGFVPAGEVARIDVVAPQGATISWLVNQEILHPLIPDRFDPTGLFK
jgi:hypothetical protein